MTIVWCGVGLLRPLQAGRHGRRPARGAGDRARGARPRRARRARLRLLTRNGGRPPASAVSCSPLLPGPASGSVGFPREPFGSGGGGGARLSGGGAADPGGLRRRGRAGRADGDGRLRALPCLRRLRLGRVLPGGGAGAPEGRALPGRARLPRHPLRARGLRGGGAGRADAGGGGRGRLSRAHRLRREHAVGDRGAGLRPGGRAHRGARRRQRPAGGLRRGRCGGARGADAGRVREHGDRLSALATAARTASRAVY